MAKALEGVRVLDLTTGPAGGIATSILADFGAEVLLVEKPGENPLAELPAARMWRRGKRTLDLDLSTPAGMDSLHELLAAADVVVCNWRPSALERKGLDFATLHARHPHLIVSHIAGFGAEGPRAEIPGYEHVVAAASGRMVLFTGIVERTGPVFSAVQVGVHACAQSTATGILAALLRRGSDGEGIHVETSMLQGMLAYEQGTMILSQIRERLGMQIPPFSERSNQPPMPSLYYHPAQAGDGRWMQFGNLLPHLFDNFLLVTDLIDVLADEDFNHAQMRLPPEKHEAFRERMLSRIQERNADEWMADFIAHGGVVATAHQTTQQALGDPDIVANGHVIERADGSTQIGPIARLTATPGEPGPDARPDDAIAARWRGSPRAAPARANDKQLPLTGLKVVELATIIASPLAASFLADMGAEVIKVEQIGGDPYRGLLLGTGAARVNGGKRSISVDLKADAGREIVLGLIRDADLVIHNFRPGVPERLGVGYEQLCEINPDIVYVQANGYGPDGPGADRPSTHPIPGAAMGGVLFQMGERVPREVQDMEGLRRWTPRLMRSNDTNPDPNTALAVTTAAMLGLVARQRTGKGQRILVDMFGANAYANHDDFLSYPGKPPRALADPMLLGLSATYRLYPCADDSWVFLALTSERERRRFVETLKGAGLEPPSVDVLAKGGDAASGALSALFAGRDASSWESLLAGAGIGCVRADGTTPAEFWLTDPQPAALGLTHPVQHLRWGEYRRHSRLVRFDRGNQPVAPPPLAGQHNEELLRERGYTDARIAELAEQGVIWREEV